jgi:hypothetical protein
VFCQVFEAACFLAEEQRQKAAENSEIIATNSNVISDTFATISGGDQPRPDVCATNIRRLIESPSAPDKRP